MTENPERWVVRKPAVTSRGGVVATQHQAASEVGARVLADGGNAVDAAIAASLALATVEPWMSGLGGGGYMLVRPAGEAQSYAVSFGMVAPGALDPADYPLTGEAGADLFGWPAVEGDRNTRGPFAVAVPGQVAGLALAHERFGSWGWADLVAPACALAERGMEVDWHATVAIAASAPELAQDPGCAATYLADGFPLATPWTGDAPRIRLGSLAETLRRLAEAGPADFYTGEIAAICADMAALGGRLSDGRSGGLRSPSRGGPGDPLPRCSGQHRAGTDRRADADRCPEPPRRLARPRRGAPRRRGLLRLTPRHCVPPTPSVSGPWARAPAGTLHPARAISASRTGTAPWSR